MNVATDTFFDQKLLDTEYLRRHGYGRSCWRSCEPKSDDGYKIRIDNESMRAISSGYDWSKSVFDAPETQRLHGVIHFSLGWYEDRRYILNERVSGEEAGQPLIP